MNSTNNYYAVAYKASLEDFNEIYSSSRFKFKGTVENHTIYYEAIVSEVNIRTKINQVFSDISSSQDDIEDSIHKLSGYLCRVIYNESKKCIFFVNDDYEHWNNIASEFGLEKIDVINGDILENIRDNNYQNILEIEMLLYYDGEDSYVSLKGSNLERSGKFSELVKTMKSVTKFSRDLESHKLELTDENIIKVKKISNDFNLRKSLSNVISKVKSEAYE